MSSRQLQKAMEDPTLELKIVSASDVSHLEATNKTNVYAVVSVNGDTTKQKQVAKTPIDYDGGPNPAWNHTVKFSINEREAKEGLINVKVELFSYWLEGKDDLYLGEVNVLVQDLLASNPLQPFVNGNVKMKSLTCPLIVPEGGSTKATLSLLYRFKPVLVDESYSPTIGQPLYQNPDQILRSQKVVEPHLDQTISSGQPVVFSPRFQATSAKLILEIVIKFAKDIEDVNAFSAMDVYASVAILKDRKVKYRINTPIAFSASTNPKWNQTIKFSFDERLAQEGRLILLVELMSHRPFLGDKEIGFARLPIQQLLISNPPCVSNNGDMKLETHALTGPYGKKGVVSFSYKFIVEQITVPTPSTASQPYIMYLPVSPHSYSTSDPIQVASSYMTLQQGGNGGPIYMPPQCHLHGHQQYSPRKPQPQHSQLKPLPHQPFPQSLPDTQEA